ncbi:ribosome silencing factor [Azospirillum sp. ST 5-10]|uniref:ribosome silencing factor n=1 Tax=unclassified Azospirillum TaxID=2630922 RepID=UPI003F49B795
MAATTVRPTPVPQALPEPGDLKALIEQSLDADQADHVVVIDLAGKTSIADYMIVASGRNARHIAAMADRLRDKIRDLGVRHVEVEGVPQCDWVLIDAGDVIVHLFRPEVRSFYNIEKMWGLEAPAAPAMDVQRLWA